MGPSNPGYLRKCSPHRSRPAGPPVRYFLAVGCLGRVVCLRSRRCAGHSARAGLGSEKHIPRGPPKQNKTNLRCSQTWVISGKDNMHIHTMLCSHRNLVGDRTEYRTPFRVHERELLYTTIHRVLRARGISMYKTTPSRIHRAGFYAPRGCPILLE